MTSPQEQVALVTGSAQGIGAGIARRMARDGRAVVLADIDQVGATVVAKEISSAGGRATAVPCDVSKRADCEAAVGAAVDTYGHLDVLVNNAGITRDNFIHKMTDDDWDAVIDTHLKGSFMMSRAAQRVMVPRRFGKIVLISSRSALGNPGQTNYSAAKAGMQGMTRTLATELGRFGITVNSVAPGHIDTPMTRATAARLRIDYEDLRKRAIEANSIKRVGTPDDIAGAVSFLASEDASYITGQVLYVAGRPTV